MWFCHLAESESQPGTPVDTSLIYLFSVLHQVILTDACEDNPSRN